MKHSPGFLAIVNDAKSRVQECTVDDVKARLSQLQAALPSDITTEVIRDQSRFIKKSIEEVKFHLLLAAGLVILRL